MKNGHGEVSLQWDNDLLIIKAYGPFNEIGVQHSLEKIQTSIEDRNLKSWRKLDFWDEDAFGSPVVMSMTKAAAHWYMANGCYASAIVICNCVQESIFKNTGQDGPQFFYDKEAAVQWLNEKKH
jgi:hypothetical protein